MSDMQLSGKVVMEYLDRFPNTPSVTLARLIYKDQKNMALFTNVESIRSIIRYYRGSLGEINRTKVKNRNHVKQV